MIRRTATEPTFSAGGSMWADLPMDTMRGNRGESLTDYFPETKAENNRIYVYASRLHWRNGKYAISNN